MRFLYSWGSPLLGRILLLNVVPLVLLAGMLLSVNQFQTSLLEEDVTALQEQAYIYARVLTVSVVRHNEQGEAWLDGALAQPLLASLTKASLNIHVRLYGPDGRLVADQRQDTGEKTQGERSSRAVAHGAFQDILYEKLLSLLPLNSIAGRVPLDSVSNGEEHSLEGIASRDIQTELPPYIRRAGHELVITVVAPVIYHGQTVGELQLTRRAPEVDEGLFSVRSTIISFLGVTLGVTVLLSLYLFFTIARPLRRLVKASQDIGESGHGRADCVPDDLLHRKDEVGALARALRVSTHALWARLDDTERFAAEVSHELKNPLSSIHTALETLLFLRDLKARDRLLGVVRQDVQRLERLIADIFEASRVEGGLSRERREAVALVPLLSMLVELHQTTRGAEETVLTLAVQGKSDTLVVAVVEDRLVQVLRNLISNAISFSPPCGVIALSVRSVLIDGTVFVELCVDDEGPGIPPGKLESIFERFYSERPHHEGFGQHSGLGLAISRQIIHSMDGQLYAENRMMHDSRTGEMRVCGARFIIRLPRCSSRA